MHLNESLKLFRTICFVVFSRVPSQIERKRRLYVNREVQIFHSTVEEYLTSVLKHIRSANLTVEIYVRIT